VPTFDSSFTVRAPLAAVAGFHHNPRVLKLLTPPPVFVQLHHVDPLSEESISEFTLWFGPLPLRWTAVHTQVDRLHGFTDTQAAGPMKCWVHTHTFALDRSGCTRVSDHIEFEHHAGRRGWLTRLLFAPIGLRFLFAYRGHVTRRIVESTRAPRTEAALR
jgi:ligand-binding SRPBCC domain-containing protein